MMNTFEVESKGNGTYKITKLKDEDAESVVIPDVVSEIGKNAFNYRKNLTSVTIPESVTKIRDYAFAGCNNLEEVNFTGTKEQWVKIDLGNNDRLKDAEITFEYNDDYDEINDFALKFLSLTDEDKKDFIQMMLLGDLD